MWSDGTGIYGSPLLPWLPADMGKAKEAKPQGHTRMQRNLIVKDLYTHNVTGIVCIDMARKSWILFPLKIYVTMHIYLTAFIACMFIIACGNYCDDVMYLNIAIIW